MKQPQIKLSHKQHTGKIMPHAHTSYAALMFILLLTGVVLAGVSLPANAYFVNPPPTYKDGSVGLGGKIIGPAPSQAAVIASPVNNSTVIASPITVTGACVPKTLISLYKNGVFAGSTVCGDDGSFSLTSDLFDGANVLIARTSDGLGQYGPDSSAVTVTLKAPDVVAGSASTIFGHRLFISADTASKGTDPGVPVTFDFSVVAGKPPYAISIDWGDNKSDLFSRGIDGPVAATHTYDQPGQYRVVVRVSDVDSNSAYIQMIAVVNGTPSPTSARGAAVTPGTLVAAWPLYLAAAFMVFCFWLGERREYNKLRRRGVLISD